MLYASGSDFISQYDNSDSATWPAVVPGRFHLADEACHGPSGTVKTGLAAIPNGRVAVLCYHRRHFAGPQNSMRLAQVWSPQ
jgi:hypothetical protein